jgi:predicted RNA-binding Zn-ribbon protein involved in translation (DUF1610 family)
LYASDHRLEHLGYHPSFAAGATQFDPDDPIHGSGLFADFQPYSTSSEGNNESSEVEFSWWMDPSLEYLGAEDYATSIWGTSVTESSDLEQPIDVDLSTKDIHEPENFPFPENSLSADNAAIAENFQSQSRSNFITPHYPSIVTIPSFHSSTPSSISETNLEWFSDITTPLSLGPEPSSSASPSSSGLSLDDDIAGKRVIGSAYAVHFCSTCKRQHQRYRNCTASSFRFQCAPCKEDFTLKKDLKRHQETSSSCLARKAKTSFTCPDCGVEYPRKDSLQRHVRTKHANKSS